LYLLNDFYFRPPSFLQKPAIKQQDGGKRILFECKIAASPKPMLTWFRDTVQLSDGGKNFQLDISIYKNE